MGDSVQGVYKEGRAFFRRTESSVRVSDFRFVSLMNDRNLKPRRQSIDARILSFDVPRVVEARLFGTIRSGRDANVIGPGVRTPFIVTQVENAPTFDLQNRCKFGVRGSVALFQDA
jgi:hypothetical protein